MSHLTEQPLYVTLRQYRVVAVAGLIFIGYLLGKLVFWFMDNHDSLSNQSTAALFAFLPSLLGAFVAAYSNYNKKHED